MFLGVLLAIKISSKLVLDFVAKRLKAAINTLRVIKSIMNTISSTIIKHYKHINVCSHGNVNPF